MNNFVVSGKALILNKQGDKNFEREANVIVRNLAKDVDQKQVFDLFKAHGHISSCKLERFPDGTSRGFCFIQYSKREEAQAAISALNGQSLSGKAIEVLPHQKRSDRNLDGQSSRFTNVFVKNLDKGTDDAKLKQLFASFGDIESASVKRSDDETLLDYGFVAFKKAESAASAVEKMNKTLMSNGNVLMVAEHISKRQNELKQSDSSLTPISMAMKKTYDSNIYIKGLPDDITEEKLRAEFGKVGKIISVKINTHPKSGYKHGFVLYESVREAQDAIKRFHSEPVFGGRAIQVDFWLSKQELEQEKK